MGLVFVAFTALGVPHSLEEYLVFRKANTPHDVIGTSKAARFSPYAQMTAFAMLCVVGFLWGASVNRGGKKRAFSLYGKRVTRTACFGLGILTLDVAIASSLAMPWFGPWRVFPLPALWFFSALAFFTLFICCGHHTELRVWKRACELLIYIFATVSFLVAFNQVYCLKNSYYPVSPPSGSLFYEITPNCTREK